MYREIIFHGSELFFQSYSNETHRGKMPNGWHFLDELECLQGLGLLQPLPVSILHGGEDLEEGLGEEMSIFAAGKSCPM